MDTSKKWKLKSLLFCHLLIAGLLTSLFLPPINDLWEIIDVGAFRFFNNTLVGNPKWQLFWALANHKLADWVEDLFILGFFIAYVKSSPKERRLRCIAELIFLCLLIAATILLLNRALFRDILSLNRASPTLILDSCVHLSDHITWMSIKDDSVKSFPADHATTALLFAAGYSYFAKFRLGFIAWAYAIFLCLPRLIGGAHWLSDLIVGSGSILIFSLSWALCTPCHLFFIDKIEKFLSLFSLRKREKSPSI